MQIILQEKDISKALAEYLSNMGFSLEGKKVSTTFKASRGDSGNEATLTIEDDISAFTEPTLTAVPTPETTESKVTDNSEELDLTDDTIVFGEG